MSDYMIVTDSCCDLSAEMIESMGICVLPLTVELDGTSYRNYPDGREIGFDEFYAKLPSVSSAKTSCVNTAEFEAAFEPLLAEGHDILYIGFSSGLSSTYNNSLIAIEDLKERYPGRKIIAVDSLAASMGQGLLVWHANELKKAGKSIEEVRDWVEANKLHLCHIFTVNDLMQLKRGGRISAAVAIAGTMLAVKPMLHVDDEGHLTKTGAVRGRKASIRALADSMAEKAIDAENQMVFISHGGCLDDANLLAGIIKERLHVKTITINYIGPVIGSHSGLGTLAVFFLGTIR